MSKIVVYENDKWIRKTIKKENTRPYTMFINSDEQKKKQMRKKKFKAIVYQGGMCTPK